MGAWQTPKRLNAVTRAYFDARASVTTGARAARHRAVLTTNSAAAERELAQAEPSNHALLRTTVEPTMLTAGVTLNVVPSTAEVVIDIRALPDEDVPALFAEMARVIDDPSAAIVPIPATRHRARGQASLPGLDAPTPAMMNAGTDMAQLRAKGVQAYGVGPAMTAEAFAQDGWYSDLERLSERALYDFVQFVHASVVDVVVAIRSQHPHIPPCGCQSPFVHGLG